jgi:hypothetical protein
MTVKRWDLDKDAEIAPRFVVAASDHEAEVERLTTELTIARATQLGPIQHYIDGLRSKLRTAEGVLRVIAQTDYRGNRSTEAMAAQAYFDAALKENAT